MQQQNNIKALKYFFLIKLENLINLLAKILYKEKVCNIMKIFYLIFLANKLILQYFHNLNHNFILK